jgi:hypothetical protein
MIPMAATLAQLLFRQRLRIAAALAALAAASLCACGSPPDDSPERQVTERLVGTWLRDYDDAGTHVRRVLELRPDGVFVERSVARGKASAENLHEGEWRFDGTNLKRRYTSVNGARPSAPMVPFATFEVRFESQNEFVGLDRVHQRKVVYQRVSEGTRP